MRTNRLALIPLLAGLFILPGCFDELEGLLEKGDEDYEDYEDSEEHEDFEDDEEEAEEEFCEDVLDAIFEEVEEAVEDKEVLWEALVSGDAASVQALLEEAGVEVDEETVEAAIECLDEEGEHEEDEEEDEDYEGEEGEED